MAAGIANAGIQTNKANRALGQTSLTSKLTGSAITQMNKPEYLLVDNERDKVYVSDTMNNRVLWWNTIDSFNNGTSADGYLGNVSTGTAAAAYKLFQPRGLSIDKDGNLWVADSGYNRVVRFNAPLTNGASAQIVLGQDNFIQANYEVNQNSTRKPYAVAVDTTTEIVWVCDTNSHRILKFHGTLSNGMNATLFIGQATPNAGNANGNATLGQVKANSLNLPSDIVVDVSSNIWVADSGNHRILRFDAPSSGGAAELADLVIGATNFVLGNPNLGQGTNGCTADSLYTPLGLYIDTQENSLWVADSMNNRVLGYDLTNATNSISAAAVFGQKDYTSRLGGVGAEKFDYCSDLAFDKSANLWVADKNNSRVVRYDYMKIRSVTPDRARVGTQKDVTIIGEGMPEDATILLLKEGEESIISSSTTITNESEAACTFDFTNAAKGKWDIGISYNDYAEGLAEGFEVFGLTVSQATPNSAFNGQVKYVELTGDGFLDGTLVAFSKSGQNNLVVSTPTVVSETSLTCTIDLAGAATGWWNITVTSGTETSTLTDGFFVGTSTHSFKNISLFGYTVLSILNSSVEATIYIPTGTFRSQVGLAMYLPEAIPPVSQSEFIATPAAVEILADSSAQATDEFTLTLKYAESLIGYLDKTKLVICYYDVNRARWIQIPSVSYPELNTVVGKMKHLSIFCVMQRSPERNLSNMIVFPNPYKPDSGTAYDNPALGYGVVFSGMTSRVRIKIFTISGELVRDVEDTDGDGMYFWDTKNSDNYEVASGVYIYIVTNLDNSSDKVKGKLAIVR